MLFPFEVEDKQAKFERNDVLADTEYTSLKYIKHLDTMEELPGPETLCNYVKIFPTVFGTQPHYLVN